MTIVPGKAWFARFRLYAPMEHYRKWAWPLPDFDRIRDGAPALGGYTATLINEFGVSGDGIEFMRPWAERVYGIPPEQVVGSGIKVRFELRDGKPVLVRLPEIDFIDNKAGKPVGSHQHIGRRRAPLHGHRPSHRRSARVGATTANPLSGTWTKPSTRERAKAGRSWT